MEAKLQAREETVEPEETALDPLTIPPKELTPEETSKFDFLLRQLQLQIRRNEQDTAKRLLEQAKVMNPGHSGVIEAEADLLAMHHRTAEAMKLYKVALEKDPGNAAIERKYALLVFQRAEVSRMAAGMGSDYEPNVSPYAMMFLSLLPGLGHMVAGQFQKGLAILLLFLLAAVWIVLTPGGISGMFGGTEFNLIVLVPALIAFGCFFYALVDASSIAQRQKQLDKPKERVQPPVDLPYD